MIIAIVEIIVGLLLIVFLVTCAAVAAQKLADDRAALEVHGKTVYRRLW